MRRYKCFLIIIAFLSLAPSLANAADDPFFDVLAAEEIGHSYGKMAADAINSASEYRNSVADFNRKIAAARAEFWRQYPNGSNIQAATKKFSDLLLTKDILLMNQTVLSGKFMGGSRAQPNAMDLISAIGGKIDDGIRPMAWEQFDKWAGLIRNRLGAHGPMGIFEFPGRYATAIAETWPAYKPYVFARDYAEFMAAGKLPPSVTGPGTYIQTLIVLELTRSLDWGDKAPSLDVDRLAEARAEAHDTYVRLTKIFGEAKVRSVATKVMKAKVNRYGNLENPASMGIVRLNMYVERNVPAPPGLIPYSRTDPYGAFFALLTNSGPREYLLGSVADQVAPLCNNCTLGKVIEQTAEPELKRLELAYGSESLASAAAEIQRAPKTWYDGYVVKPWAKPYWAIIKRVSSKNPRGFVRWMILKDVPNISGKEALNAAYQKLAAHYPQPEIIKAARGLIDPRTLPYGLRTIARVHDPQSLGSLTALVGVLREMHNPALQAKKEPKRVKDPTYLAWASFAPGTTVTVRQTEIERQKPYTRKIPNGPDIHVAGWERVTGQSVLTTRRLVSVDDKKIVLNSTTRAGIHPPRTEPVQAYYATRAPGTVFSFPFGAHVGLARKPVKKVESGSETLVIAGKSLQTRWWAVTYGVNAFMKDRTDKVWFSDQVPGGIVKEIWSSGTVGKISSFIVQEVTLFHGVPRPRAPHSLYAFLSSSFGTDAR